MTPRHSQQPSDPALHRRRGQSAFIPAPLFLAALGWTAWFLTSAPPDVLIRMRLNDGATPGSPWRSAPIPVEMLFVFAVLGYAEKLGVISSASEPSTPDGARRIAARRRLFCMELLLRLAMSVVAGGHWSWSEATHNMVVCVALCLTALLGVPYFARGASWPDSTRVTC